VVRTDLHAELSIHRVPCGLYMYKQWWLLMAIWLSKKGALNNGGPIHYKLQCGSSCSKICMYISMPLCWICLKIDLAVKRIGYRWNFWLLTKLNSHCVIYSLFFEPGQYIQSIHFASYLSKRARTVSLVSAFKSRGIICPWLQRTNDMNSPLKERTKPWNVCYAWS